MDSLTARQFQLSKVWNNYAEKYYERIHAFERKTGRVLTPYEIHKRCQIKDHGDVSESVIEKIRPTVWAIYEEKKQDMIEVMKKDPMEDWDELTIIHWVDDKIKDKKLDFSEVKQSGVFNRVNKAYQEAQQEPAPY